MSWLRASQLVWTQTWIYTLTAFRLGSWRQELVFFLSPINHICVNIVFTEQASWNSQPGPGLSFNLRLFRLFRLSWPHTSAWSLSRPPTQSCAPGFGNKTMPNCLPSLPNKCSPSLPWVHPWNGFSVREVFWWGLIMCAVLHFKRWQLCDLCQPRLDIGIDFFFLYLKLTQTQTLDCLCVGLMLTVTQTVASWAWKNQELAGGEWC